MEAEETQSPGRRRSFRPPLWVMSVLVAVAVLFYLVENRPVAKHVVSAKPAAATQSTAHSPATHRPAAKPGKGTKAVDPAGQPGPTVVAGATYPPVTVGPGTDPTATIPPSLVVAPAAPAPAVPASPAFAG